MPNLLLKMARFSTTLSSNVNLISFRLLLMKEYAAYRPTIREIPTFVSYLASSDIISSKEEVRHICNNAKRKEISSNEPFSVLVWNLHRGKDPSVFQEAKTMNADIMLFQEFVDFSYIRDSELLADKEARMGVSFYWKPNNELPSGVCTASRLQSKSEKAFKTKHREVMLTPKSALFTSYQIKESRDELGILNIHGINFVHNSRFQYFLDELDNYAESHVGPFIFAGDFNTWSRGREKIVSSIMDKHQLEPVLLPNATQRFGKVLDRIYTRGISVEEASVLNSKASDHKPLLVRLSINDRK